MKKYAFSVITILSLLTLCDALYASLVVYITSNAYVDWTKGVIVYDFSTTTDFLVGSTFSKKILDLKETVKKKLLSETFSLLMEIPFDENRKVKDILELFPEKRRDIVSLLERTEIKNFRYFGGKVLARYTINIYGQDGIFDIIKLPSIPRDYRELLNLSEPKEFTGLIISTKNQKFNASLSTKILSETGKVIYSYADYRGRERYIHFFTSLESAIKSGKFGNKILYTVPLRIEGENLTSIVLENSIVERLLASEENHEIFFKGRVGIIVED